MPFLPRSRYAGVATVEARTRDGRIVTAVKLRRFSAAEGAPHEVGDAERLDLISQRAYRDGARFWRIADANTELQARALEEVGRVIVVPDE